MVVGDPVGFRVTASGAQPLTYQWEVRGTNEFSCTPIPGATLTCSFKVTVLRETPPPVINCPPNVRIECGSNILPAKTGLATATAAAGCNPVSLTYSDSSVNGAKPIGKVITRTWTATDACGKKSTCDQTITVVDTKGPVIHQFSAAPAKPSPAKNKFVKVKLVEVVEDSCSTDRQTKRALSVKVSDPAGSDGKTYFVIKSLTEVSLRAKKGVSYTLTLTATDAFGNSSSKAIVVPVK